MAHDIKLGDVYVDVWGYDQTNVDFYQVVKITEKTIVLQKLKTTKSYSKPDTFVGTCLPVIDSFCPHSKPVRSYVKRTDAVRVGSHFVRKWNGLPMEITSYA